MPVLVWGVVPEPPLARVLDELERRHAAVALLDQHQVLQCELHTRVGADGELTGTLTTPNESYSLQEVTAVYARPYETHMLASVVAAGVGSDAWQRALSFDEALCAWMDASRALVVNRRGPTSTNGSKPFQLERIRCVGFDIPETLITTDPAEAEAFWTRNTDVVYKSISSTRSIVQQLRPAHRARFGDIATCPTQFQRRVHGTDYRVHVVGDQVFACEILSHATDYRYPGDDPVVIRATALPDDVAERCLRAAHLLELHVAGIDLRRTADDRWFCFEVNPSPAFAYFEDGSGVSIGAAIADLLIARCTSV